MRVVRDLSELPEPSRPSVVTVGNFDGVHLAHQRLMRGVVERARRLDAAAVAVTLHPHPAQVLAPARAPKLLTTLEQKIRLIEEQGIDLLLVIPFTREFSLLTPAEFVASVLIRGLGTRAVHVGPNFRFGHRQAGDVRTLEELARQDGLELEVLPAVECRGERVSSSRIRELLSQGQVSKAGRLLGRPYSVGGPVVAGSGVGKTQTVPTLNLAPIDEQLPKDGVYVTRTRPDKPGDWQESVTNVGRKPTFGDHRLTVESFLLNFSGQIDAAAMEVQFLHRLRDEAKFPNPAALKAQIQKDVRQSLRFFQLLKLFGRRESRSATSVS